MNVIKRLLSGLCLATSIAFPLTAAGADTAQPPGAVEAVGIAVDAYIYGYPLFTLTPSASSRPTW